MPIEDKDPLFNHPSVAELIAEDMDEDVSELELTGADEYIRKQIVHVLTQYPGISSTMLQVGIGTSIPSKLWRPIYDAMIKAHQVIEIRDTVQMPSGRFQSLKHIRLSPSMTQIPSIL